MRFKVVLEFEMEAADCRDAAERLTPLVGEADKLAQAGTMNLACWDGQGEPPAAVDRWLPWRSSVSSPTTCCTQRSVCERCLKAEGYAAGRADERADGVALIRDFEKACGHVQIIGDRIEAGDHVGAAKVKP